MASPEQSQWSLSDQLTVYQILSDRRTAYDSMMWQTPALGMTAQAFLLTLALSSDTSGVGRATSAGLSILISLMVLQLLAKHRRNETLDSLVLEDLEKKLGVRAVLGVIPHGHPRERSTADQRRLADSQVRKVLRGPKGFWRMSSFKLWCYGQYALILVGLAIVVLVVLGQRTVLSTL